jgi:hypothetical protein
MTGRFDVSQQLWGLAVGPNSLDRLEVEAMNPTQPDGPEPKSRKGRGNKSPKTQDAKGKVKIAAYVSLESARRLGIHATMTGQDRSSIIDQLIREQLRDWVVQYRPSNKPGEDSDPEPEAQAC